MFKAPESPHLAASLEQKSITKIAIPDTQNLIIEGAGGLLVPLNKETLMIDWIQDLPVILVARTTLGTINHTLLSLEALRSRHIKVLGIIMNGIPNPENSQAIEFYGRTKILAQIPFMDRVNREKLSQIPLTKKLTSTFGK